MTHTSAHIIKEAIERTFLAGQRLLFTPVLCAESCVYTLP